MKKEDTKDSSSLRKPEQRLFTTREAAVYLGIAEGTIYNLVSEKAIDVVRLKGLKRGIRFDKVNLDCLIAEGTSKAHQFSV